MQQLWADATLAGVAPQLLAHPWAVRQLAACGQVYAAAAAVRLAAEQLGMLGLVAELAEAWGAVEGAWRTPLPHPAGSPEQESAAQQQQQQDAQEEEDEREAEWQALVFSEAVLRASSQHVAATAPDVLAGREAPALLQVVEGAAGTLQGLSVDEFPRMLAWSGGARAAAAAHANTSHHACLCVFSGDPI